MSWYAVDAVDDAIDATRRFLFPFSLVRWTKLAIIALFIGGSSASGNVSNLPSLGGELNGPISPETGQVPTASGLVPSGIPPISTELLVAFAAGIAGFAVIVTIVSTVLKFVFYDALRTDEVLLWRPFKRRFLQGIRLLLFQIVVSVLIFAPFAIAGYGLYVTEPQIPSRVALLTAAALLLLLAFLFWILLLRFTDDFVVPIMVLENQTVLGAWSRFWPTLTAEWVQFLVYLVVYFFLALGIGIGQSIVTIILGGIVVALGAIVGLVVVGILGGFAAALESVIGLALLAILVVVVILALAVVILPIRVLVLTYLTGYQLAVLGGANDSFMLLPESILPDPDVLEKSGGNGRGPDRMSGQNGK